MTYENINSELDNELYIINNDKRIIWLYSSYFNWWCYDKKSMKKLEKMHYYKLINSNNVNEFNNKEFENIMNSIRYNFPINYDFKLNNDEIEDFESETESYNNENNNEIITELENEIHQPEYNLTFGKTEYIIDLDKMIQYNKMDRYKMRNVKRVEIPDNITDVKTFLQLKYNVVGISGVKFN